MRNLSVHLLAVVMLVLITSATCFAVQEVTILGDKSYPPYTYEENGELKGLYIDLLKEVSSKMNDYNLTIKPVSWRTGINAVKSGKAFAMFPPYKTLEREPWMNFGAPLLKEKVVVWGKKSNLAGKSNWPEDFFGSTVALNSGFSTIGMGGKKFDEALKAKKLHLKTGKTTKKCLKFLMLGKSDFYLADAMLNTSDYHGGDSFVAGPVAVEQSSYLGITKQGNNFPFTDDFILEFNKQMTLLNSSGFVEELMNKYKK